MNLILSKIKKAVKNPQVILNRSLWLLHQLKVKRVIKNGNIFYQYKGELYPECLSKGNAASFIIDTAKKYCYGKGLDIGADIWPFPGAIPVQEKENENAYRLDNFSNSCLDYIFSSHCLEHLERWQDALSLWITKLKIDGILFLYLPHQSMLLWKPGAPWVRDFHKWSPTYEVIKNYLEQNGMEIIDYNSDKDKYWSFHIAAKKILT